ncbi:MAG: hypothetical protein ACR2NN_01990 [Bryobacteraceae bacterium]
MAWTLISAVFPLLAQNKAFQDRAEYEIFLAVQKQAVPAERLVLLRQWAEKYPRSAFRQERFYSLITTQQALGQSREMLRTAEQMAADDRKGLGNYWITVLTTQLQDVSTSALNRSEKAAQALLHDHYSPENKPEAVPREAWIEEKARSGVLAHRTLGWIALNRKQWTKAIAELKLVLAEHPDDAAASFWLGSGILGQKRIETEPLALYYYARALTITGPGALTPEAKAQVQGFLEKAYSERYGNRAGLAKLYEQARSGTPPAFAR